MSSSTSSFRTELKVLATVLLVLSGLEWLMGVSEGRLSADIAHIKSGERIAARLAAGQQGRRLLLLGNSLTREGLVPDAFAAAAGGQLTVEAYYPDGSSVNEWAYAYRRFFLEPGKSPEFLIIGAGRSHLFDSELRPERFGAYFCSDRDIPRYFRRHVRDLDQAAGFLLARFSAAYANRQRVQPRVFTVLIPHYQAVLPRLAARPRPAAGGGGRGDLHRNLTELLEAARAAGTRTAVVAIPMPEEYPLPESTRAAIAAGGATLIDARELPGIGAANYPDHYHLDAAGAAVLTRHVVEVLQPLWLPESADEH